MRWFSGRRFSCISTFLTPLTTVRHSKDRRLLLCLSVCFLIFAASSGGASSLNAIHAGPTNAMLQSMGGSPITYVYDELGRLVGVIDPAGDTVIYTYDAVGNVLSISRHASTVISIINFTPQNGVAGTSVTINGTGFSATASQNTVQFNGVTATVVSSSPTQIVTAVPAGATSGPITVTSPSGSATSSANFIVSASTGAPTITSFTPTMGIPGTAVTITGTNFDSTLSNNRIHFNVPPADASSASPTTLGTAVPVSGTSGRISVSTVNGKAVSPQDFYVPFKGHAVADIGFTGRMGLNSTQTVSIGTAGKIGLMLFDGTEGQRASVQMSGGTFSTCTLYLFDPYGNQVASNLCSGATNFMDAQKLAFTGTYTLGIDPGGTTGSVNLTLNGFSDVTGTITAGTPVTATTTAPGQNARYTFTAAAGQQFSVKIIGSTYTGCTAVIASILKPDGTALGSTSICNGSTGFVDSVTVPGPGTYTVLLDPQGTLTGSATLLLSAFLDVTGTITLGTPVTATTTAPGQNARYTFSGTAGQQVSVKVTGSTYPGCFGVTANLLKPDGTSLGSNSTCNGATAFVDSLTLPSTGTYTVLMDPSGTNTGSATVLLSVFADITGTITPGTAITVTTTAAGQNARYTFSGTAGQQISVQLTNSTYSGCFGVTAKILKPDGTSLGSNSTCNGSTAFVDSMTLPSTGTYTVLIDPSGTNSGSVTVLLNVFADIVGTITPGTAVSVTTTTAGQNARYTFTGTAGQQFSISLTNSTYSGCFGVTASLLKPDGTSLGSNSTCNGSTAFVDSMTLTVSGTYTVLIDPSGTNTGSVNVLLNNFTDISGTITPGTPITVTTSSAGQNARYTFSGTAGQQVSIQLTNSTYPGCFGVTAKLLKSDGTSLGSNSTCNGATAFVDSMTLPTAGTYTVQLDPSGSNTGSTTVLLSTFADITGTITPGTAINVTTTAPGQNARYTFSGTAGQQVSLSVASSTYTGCTALAFSILKPTGSSLGSNSTCSSTGFLDSLTLPTTGTYTVLIDPAGAGTGSATITLNTFADIAGTFTSGTAITVTTTTPGQNARYTFSGTSGQHASLSLTGSTYTGCTALTASILKPDGTSLGSNTTCSATLSLGPLALPSTGTYTVLIDPAGSGTGSVTVTLTLGP